MIGAALLARDGPRSRRSGEAAASVAMTRPARRLPDADREPRGRHAARARGAARGRRRGLRGHAPHARAARALRRAGDARLLPRAQRARAGGRAGRADARRARSSRWSPTPGCRWCPIPATCSCRAASPRGWRSRCCPGPSAALAALVASRAARRTRWRFAGFLPRKRGGAGRACFGSPETLVAFESPRRVAASLAVLAELDPDAPGRRLPRADQAARGGRARHARPSWPRATQPPSRAARSCSSSAARRRGRRSTTRRSTRSAGSSRRAPSRAPPPAWSPSSPAPRRTRCTRRPRSAEVRGAAGRRGRFALPRSRSRSRSRTQLTRAAALRGSSAPASTVRPRRGRSEPRSPSHRRGALCNDFVPDACRLVHTQGRARALRLRSRPCIHPPDVSLRGRPPGWRPRWPPCCRPRWPPCCRP